MPAIMQPTRDPARRWRLGTRGSPLALAQAEAARRRICAARHLPLDRVQLYPISTLGDRRRDRPLAELGGKAVFSREIDAALVAGRIDIAIHSAKDLPGILAPGLTIAAALPRADPRDCLVSAAGDLRRLPPGATVGTGSPRRRAQLLALRPDLEIRPLRGNVGTRLAAVAPAGALAATLLACAGLDRLRLRPPNLHPIHPDDLLPAVGQGVIAAVVRADDPAAADLAAGAGDAATATALAAERGLLAALGGDCHSPIAGHARLHAGEVRLSGEILSPDGSIRFRRQVAGPAAAAADLGAGLAAELNRLAGPGFWDPPGFAAACGS